MDYNIVFQNFYLTTKKVYSTIQTVMKSGV